MANTRKRKDYKNINTDKLPNTHCVIGIILNGKKEKDILLCDWLPFNPVEWDVMPPDGYQGTLIERWADAIPFESHTFRQKKKLFTYYQTI